ncbi:hypothetical protein HU735_10920 [Pseudomonas sp. BW16M2]|uniref:hypothetical protein n=1 Tax=Pseudomonas sp. BW16M2 TaxID=2745489 RepID=UPI0016488913|nr:hypothetical protein [Pseudomonas sp. BW16M2]MBC3435925.1 hypothetical protein [Pseudomonas sp. BW16M2]
MKNQKNQKKIHVNIGDIFSVPLFGGSHVFGYIRAYQDPDVAILPIISKGRVLSKSELPSLVSNLDVSSLRNAIESGEWALIANIPFPDEESSWAPPRRQAPVFKADTRRTVIVKGQIISAEAYGEYDNLPMMIRLDDKGLKEQIERISTRFPVIE